MRVSASRFTNINSHVIEKCCEHEEHSAGNTSKEEQLSVEETCNKSNDAVAL